MHMFVQRRIGFFLRERELLHEEKRDGRFRGAVVSFYPEAWPCLTGEEEDRGMTSGKACCGCKLISAACPDLATAWASFCWVASRAEK